MDLTNGSLSEDLFLKHFQTYGGESLVLGLLKQAKDERDSDGAEYALLVGFKLGFKSDSSVVLSELLTAPWHEKHEDIAIALRQLKAECSVDALYETALTKYDYLDYDDSYALAVKCIWALGTIGSQVATEKLKLLEKSENEIISEEAAKQLERLHSPS